MRKNKLMYILALLFFVTTACTEDFLERTNPNEVDGAIFFTSVENFDLALTGTYSAWNAFELYGGDFMNKVLYPLARTSDQDFVASGAWNAMHQHDMHDRTYIVRDAWRSFYRIIYRANDVLENADIFMDENDLTASQQTRMEEIIAEAKFNRAYAYFHLIRLFGEGLPATDAGLRGVPLILKVAQTREEMNVPRATIGAVYDQIIIDLTDAIAVLPEVWDDSNKARASRWAAIALRGKVRLYQEQWPLAKQDIENVIMNGPFELVSFDDYQFLFHEEIKFSKESIWELSFSTDMVIAPFGGGMSSIHPLIIAPRGAGWHNLFVHDENIRRFGDDPRLRIIAREPGVDSVYTSEGKVLLEKSPRGELGWSFKKYTPLYASVYATNQNYGANYHKIRLADLYLLYAEILNQEGDDNIAAEYMNKVRRRAYGLDPDTPDPEVDYNVSGIALRDSIREERFRELFGEGHRWYDIARWRIAEEEAARYVSVSSGSINFNGSHKYYLPIHFTEMDFNSEMEQSMGYD